MTKFCVICGTKLKTRRKYCSYCRPSGRATPYAHDEDEQDYYQGKQIEPNAGLVIVGVLIFIFVMVAFQGLMEILKALGNFLYSIWIIILIISFSIAGFEIWRISKEGINGIHKFERIIFAVSFSIIFMIILLAIFK